MQNWSRNGVTVSKQSTEYPAEANKLVATVTTIICCSVLNIQFESVIEASNGKWKRKEEIQAHFNGMAWTVKRSVLYLSVRVHVSGDGTNDLNRF